MRCVCVLRLVLTARLGGRLLNEDQYRNLIASVMMRYRYKYIYIYIKYLTNWSIAYI